MTTTKYIKAKNLQEDGSKIGTALNMLSNQNGVIKITTNSDEIIFNGDLGNKLNSIMQNFLKNELGFIQNEFNKL